MAQAATHEQPHMRAKRMLKESGYHGDKVQDEGLVKTMVKKNALKRKSGGDVGGEMTMSRPDKRARGGAMKMKGPKIGAVNVNVHHSDPAAEQVAKQQGVQQGLQAGMKMGAQRAMAAQQRPPMPPPRPPMAPPPGATPGMGAPGGAPQMAQRPPMAPQASGMMADGGAVRKDGGKVEC
jgi:hypothetical protein